MAAPANPCTHCEYGQDCGTNVGLERLIYDRPTFKKPVDPAAFIKSGVGRATYELLTRIVAAWRATVATLTDPTRGRITTQAFCHTSDGRRSRSTPTSGSARPASPPGPSRARPTCRGARPRGTKRYPGKDLLSRPNGRMIGDFDALALRAIIEHLIGPDAHYASGAGHRGEFDLIVATEEQLILGEIKASPLVAFPIG